MNNYSFGTNFSALEQILRAVANNTNSIAPPVTQDSWRTQSSNSGINDKTVNVSNDDNTSNKYASSSRSDRRRSYSRSRSPSYDRYRRRRSRSRERNRSRDYDRHRRSRSRHRSPRRRRSPIEVLSSKIIINNLPTQMSKESISLIMSRQGFYPVDIRVVRRVSDVGSPRVFAFVEFNTPAQASTWMKFNDGYLTFDNGYKVRMEYSRENEHDKRVPTALDWTCAKCTINNFNRRNMCFKCGTSRENSEALEAKGYALVGIHPCDTLLIRELPASATEDSIRSAFAHINLTIQRVHIAQSKGYALVQMKFKEDASYLLNSFNKAVPYVDNCAVIVTFSRQSLNQILIMDNVNILKSQSGITSENIQQDPTNSAAMLAQNALQIAQMSKQSGAILPNQQASLPPETVLTPFGYLQIYPTPNSQYFQFEPVSGYYYDKITGFYYDSKTEYYYNSTTNQWMFWSTKYNTYIPCEGGDLELKKSLQEQEKIDRGVYDSSISTSENLPKVENKVEQNEPQKPCLNDDEFDEDAMFNKKNENSKAKTALDIQREMNKWARRQEKVKMTFKASSDLSSLQKKGSDDASSNTESIKKPWDDADEDETENPVVPEAVLYSRMRNVGLPLNYQTGHGYGVSGLGSGTSHLLTNEPSSSNVHAEHAGNEQTMVKFDEEQYLDRDKRACLLCRRQFPNMDTLNKHIQMSDLHKSNLATKLKEFQSSHEDKNSSDLTIQYRDRAKERRQLHGLDPTGLSSIEESNYSDPKSAEEVASYKAKVPLDESNIGNRMLKSMGWSEGQGLGRNSQGIVNPLTADQRVQGVGLGASGSKVNYGLSRRERLKQAAIQRFNDLTD